MKVDIIMLSNTASHEHYCLTSNAITTINNSDPTVEFRIILMETQKELPASRQYKHFNNVIVVHPDEEFNYNKYLNIGWSIIRDQPGDYVVFANNDLRFEYGWATQMDHAAKQENLDAISFLTLDWWRHTGMPDGVHVGYENGITMTPWCIAFPTDSVYDIMPLDERFSFWYQDDDLIKVMESLGFKHALVTNARIYHHGSQSFKLVDKHRKNDMMIQPPIIFNQKWFAHKNNPC